MLSDIIRSNDFFIFRNFVFFVSLIFLSVILTYLCRRYVRIMDSANERSSHTGAIPRSGGIAIVSSFCIGILVYYVLRTNYFIGLKPFWGLFFSALMVALVSLYDDITNKAFVYKLLSQLIGVMVLLIFELRIRELAIPWFGIVELGIWGYPLTVLWIVGLTNAFNFMDGLNGLAAGTAVIVGIGFAFITYWQDSVFVFHVSYMLAAVAIGFLVFNFRKNGNIFMGDVGSSFIGFMFGAIAILAANFDRSHTSFMVMPILFAHFIMETFYTVAWRYFKGYKIYEAHKMHPYQLLTQMGLQAEKVVIIYYIMSILLLGLACLYMCFDQSIKMLILFSLFVAYLIYFILIHKSYQKKQN